MSALTLLLLSMVGIVAPSIAENFQPPPIEPIAPTFENLPQLPPTNPFSTLFKTTPNSIMETGPAKGSRSKIEEARENDLKELEARNPIFDKGQLIIKPKKQSSKKITIP